MPQEMSDSTLKELLRCGSKAAGFDLPAERIDLNVEAYRLYLEAVSRLDDFELNREAQPATLFQLSASPRRGG